MIFHEVSKSNLNYRRISNLFLLANANFTLLTHHFQRICLKIVIFNRNRPVPAKKRPHFEKKNGFHFDFFFRNRSIWTEKIYFGSSKELSWSKMVVLIKIDLFLPAKWLNFKWIVMSFFEMEYLHQKTYIWIHSLNHFRSKIVIFDRNRPVPVEKRPHFGKKLKCFFEKHDLKYDFSKNNQLPVQKSE